MNFLDLLRLTVAWRRKGLRLKDWTAIFMFSLNNAVARRASKAV
jgi:hypothetical protein